MFNLHIFLFCFSVNHARNYNLLQTSEYCPTSIDCLTNTTLNATITDNTAKECCAQCSCQKDCGRFMPCCFDADNEMYTPSHGKECVDHFVGDRTNFGGQGHVIFWSSGTIDCLFTFENGVPLMR